jgi:hypothetical protein
MPDGDYNEEVGRYIGKVEEYKRKEKASKENCEKVREEMLREREVNGRRKRKC